MNTSTNSNTYLHPRREEELPLTNYQSAEQPGIFRRFFVNPIYSTLAFIGRLFCGKREEEPDDDILIGFPNKVHRLNEFRNSLSERIGIVVLFMNKDRRFLNDLYSEIERDNNYLIDILKVNFQCMSLMVNTQEGRRVRLLN